MTMAKRKTPVIHSDFGTPQRAQHGPVVIERVDADLVDTSNRDRAKATQVDDPLVIYRRQRTITTRQRDAGVRLRSLWNGIGWEPRVTGNYSGMRTEGRVEGFQVQSIDDYKEYIRALAGLTPNVRSAVIAVVCFQERLARHKVRSLKNGLTKLVRHFGLT